MFLKFFFLHTFLILALVAFPVSVHAQERGFLGTLWCNMLSSVFFGVGCEQKSSGIESISSPSQNSEPFDISQPTSSGLTSQPKNVLLSMQSNDAVMYDTAVPDYADQTRSSFPAYPVPDSPNGISVPYLEGKLAVLKYELQNSPWPGLSNIKTHTLVSESLHSRQTDRIYDAISDVRRQARSDLDEAINSLDLASPSDPDDLPGGNADFLNSLDSTQFLRSDVSNSFTSGTLTFGGGTSLSIGGDTMESLTGSGLLVSSGALTVSGLGTGNFASNAISQWTNDSNYISNLSAFSTNNLAEGSNLYYTDARARNAFSNTATGLNYDQGSGTLSLSADRTIPLTASVTQWSDFYTAPSTRIIAGTGLSWSGNTLNSTVVSSSQWTTTGSDIYYDGGNVGVGTTTPSAKLALETGSAATIGQIIKGVSSQTADYLRIIDSSNNSRLVFTANGRLGIGASPDEAAGNRPLVQIVGNQGLGQLLLSSTISESSVNKSSAIAMGHYNPGWVSFGLFTGNSNASANMIGIGGGTGVGTNNVAATQLDFYTAANTTTLNGTSRMTINSSGNVGIGTSSPLAKLNVVGNAAIGIGNVSVGSNGFAMGYVEDSNYISSTGSGSLAFGASTGGSGYISSSGAGSLAGGRVGANAVITASGGVGSIALGEAVTVGTGISSLNSSGSGSIVLGRAIGNNATGRILSSGTGSIAMGYALNRVIQSSGSGSFAGGYALNGNVTSSNSGSFVWGDDITASAANSFALGSGFTNSTANSFMVGYNTVPELTVRSGAVGIGTAAPAFPLDVAGKIGIGGQQVLHVPGGSLTWTLVVGNGGQSLSHSSGLQGQYNTLVGLGAGEAATAAHSNSALGAGALYALTTGISNNALGTLSMLSATTASYNVAVGHSSLQNNVSGIANVAVGHSSLLSNTGSYNTALGSNTIAQGAVSSSVVIGYLAAATASNQLVIGGNDASGFVNDAYLGRGVASATQNNVTLQASGRTGSNLAGSSLTLAGGKATGNAAGGAVVISTSGALGSGSALQPLAERMRVTGAGNVGIGTTTPGVKLDVLGTHVFGVGVMRFKGDSSFGYVTADQSSGTGASGFLLNINGTKRGQVEYHTTGGLQLHNTVADSVNPKISINDDGNVLLAQVSGNVGIGTVSPQKRLHVQIATDDAPVRFEDSNGYCEINPTSTTWTCTSDERLKDNITTMETSILERMGQLRPVTFTWKTDMTNVERQGLIAQEVEAIFPELVNTDNNGFKSVSYGGFTVYFIQAIQELSRRVEAIARWFGEDRFNVQGDICVDDVCVTKDEFKRILQSGGVTHTTGSSQSNAHVGDSVPDEISDENLDTDTEHGSVVDPAEGVPQSDSSDTHEPEQASTPATEPSQQVISEPSVETSDNPVSGETQSE